MTIGQYRRGREDTSWSLVMTLPSGSKVGPISLGKVSELEASLKAVELFTEYSTRDKAGVAQPTRKEAAKVPTFRDAAITCADRLEKDYRATLKAFPGTKGISKGYKFAAPRSKILGPLMAGLGDVPWSDIKPAARKWLAGYRLENGQKPSQGTIGNINHALQKVCDVAVENGWLSDDPNARPRLSKKGFGEGGREPAFTRAEMEQLKRFMSDAWVNERDSTCRRMMRVMVALISTAGTRPGIETNSLTEGQFEFTDESILINIHANQGKYKKSRTAVCREDDVFDIHKVLWDHFAWRRANWKCAADRDTTSIFANPATGRVPQLDDTFKAMLAESGLEMCPRDHKPRVLYSLRHYCLTQSVMAGINDQILCMVYGTSPAMIMRHYNQARTRDVATQISGVKAGIRNLFIQVKGNHDVDAIATIKTREKA